MCIQCVLYLYILLLINNISLVSFIFSVSTFYSMLISSDVTFTSASIYIYVYTYITQWISTKDK